MNILKAIRCNNLFLKVSNKKKAMNCKKVIKLIPDYIDKNLSIDQHDLVKEHLSECKKCNYYYQNLISSLEYLKPTKEISEQVFYYTRLKQKMENKYDKDFGTNLSIFRQKILQPVFYLASIFFAVYIGILIGSNSSKTNQLSDNNTKNDNYIEIFAESQHLNDLKIEIIENDYLINDTITK